MHYYLVLTALDLSKKINSDSSASNNTETDFSPSSSKTENKNITQNIGRL